MTTPAMIIRHLEFTGSSVVPTGLHFKPGLNLVYGASNTGKSFAMKSIDFMLGGKKALPDINERLGYEKIWFGFSLADDGDYTLTRAIKGGGFSLYEGLITSEQTGLTARKLNSKHDVKKDDNISQFLLNYIGLKGRLIATNAAGQQDNLSFRDIAKICLVKEKNIMDEISPIEGGDRDDIPKERSVFRLLLTGTDDSAIIPVMDQKTFNTSKTVRIEVIEAMITDVDLRLSSDYPDIEDIPAQHERLDTTLSHIQSELDRDQGTIEHLLEEKRRISTQILQINDRIEEIKLHIERFSRLEEVYLSDIERLMALEEAGFILSLGTNLECSLCGAPAEAQKHILSLGSVEQVRHASVVEIEKIERQRSELAITLSDLQQEKNKLKTNIETLTDGLALVEQKIVQLMPLTNKRRHVISEIIEARDRAREGLALIDQKKSLTTKLEDVKRLKQPSKSEKPNLDAPGNILYEFCNTVSSVLKQWKYPGNCDVSFDDKTYDLRIDGKLRIDNGKGVRAVTHAAFKVALLLFCRERNLPHPGFIVLDTPLLTYRDPMKNTRYGALSEDEKALAKTTVKESFFEHLYSIRDLGQFIILENIDPPTDINRLAHVHLFSGNSEDGRYGLFPVPSIR